MLVSLRLAELWRVQVSVDLALSRPGLSASTCASLNLLSDSGANRPAADHKSDQQRANGRPARTSLPMVPGEELYTVA